MMCSQEKRRGERRGTENETSRRRRPLSTVMMWREEAVVGTGGQKFISGFTLKGEGLEGFRSKNSGWLD